MAKRAIRCRFCQSCKTRRWGRRNGTQRFYCLGCHRLFTGRLVPRRRVSFREQVALTRSHLEGRTSIRTLADHTGHAKQTVMEAIHSVTAQCVSAAWIATNLKPTWSGFLALDGKIVRVWDWAAKHFRYTKQERRWLHKLSLLVALDLGTLDVPAHHLGDDEGAIDLTLFLRELKATGYVLKGFVSDGNRDIPRAVARVFGPGIPHQLCVRHFLENLRTKCRSGDVTVAQYGEACRSILAGKRPKLLRVPTTLFTYRQTRGLPRTNQACENFIRFLSLRLKTMGQFQSWQTAADYTTALVLYRRFKKFTDRKRQPNGKAPLELASCDLTDLDYLTLGRKTTSN